MKSILPYIEALLLVYAFAAAALNLWIATASHVRKRYRHAAKQTANRWERFTRFYLLRTPTKIKKLVHTLLVVRMVWIGFGIVQISTILLCHLFQANVRIPYNLFQAANYLCMAVFLRGNRTGWKGATYRRPSFLKLIHHKLHKKKE